MTFLGVSDVFCAMVHDAYEASQLLKLPLNIECLEAFDDNLVVGTKQGHLLMYAVNNANNAPQLLRTNKFFSKKPIIQLKAVPEFAILIALTADAVVSVHDMDLAASNFPVIARVERSKGASSFAVDLRRPKTLTGETSVVVRMVVAVKKKLQFYYWKNRKFHDLLPDVSLPDTPKSLAWCHESVCVGFRGEYALIKTSSSSSDKNELFPTGKNSTASVSLMRDERFALAKDEQTTFIDLDGQMKLYAVSWSEPPLTLVHDPPYLVGVLDDAVEVRVDKPRLNVQTLDLPKPRFASAPSSRRGRVYVASNSYIWSLRMIPPSIQIPHLLRDKQFELAVTLSNLGDDSSLEDKTKRVQQIRTLYAFDLFVNHKFKESLDVFYQLDIDPCHVIGLVPKLLPKEHRDSLAYPDKLPLIQGRSLEEALLAMVEYLTQVRHRLNGLNVKEKNVSPLSISGNGDRPTKYSKKKMMEIVDTSLLKCYLRTNAALVAPLVRLKDNHCHEQETERELRKTNRLSELVIYYNGKGKHVKALKLLKEQHLVENSPLKGLQKSVQYLQNLFVDPQHLDLVFEHAEWILDVSEDEGLRVFTEEEFVEAGDAKSESEKRIRVFQFLQRKKTTTVIRYLRHVISEWGDSTALLHDALILRYKDYIADLLQEQPQNSAALEVSRTELMEFVTTSKHFTPELILPQLPTTTGAFEEERAVLLGKLCRHEEALVILLAQVKDVAKTEAYCAKHYDADAKVGTSAKEIYTSLFRLQLEPPPRNVLLRMGIRTDDACESDVSAALETLKKHGECVDLMTALKCLPDSVLIADVAEFLSHRMASKMSRRHRGQVERGLLHAQHLQRQEERIALESQKVVVGELDVCKVCGKRFKNRGAVVRLAKSGRVVHFSCQEKSSTSPI